MATTPVFLPGKFHRQRSLEGYSLWGLRELDMTEQLSMHDEILMSATSHLYIKDEGIESHINKIGTTRDKSSWWTGRYGVSSSVTAALQQTHTHTIFILIFIRPVIFPFIHSFNLQSPFYLPCVR